MNPATQDHRLSELVSWTSNELEMPDWTIRPASADASFRRYFRLSNSTGSYILMDAPPDQEDIKPFIRVTEKLRNVAVNAPAIHAINQETGFLMLDDLGQESYLNALTEHTVTRLYQDALDCLLKIQQADTSELPVYDQALLLNEMSLFTDWFLGRHLGITLSTARHQLLAQTQNVLVENALSQPQVFVHRDYHSRNLMVTAVNNPGVIDHQDAVIGPITYDLVSLLRDCYIAWPVEQVRDWALAYRDRLVTAGLLEPTEDRQFMRWFDLMGVQRHLKAIGIFSRLNHRDGKAGYLRDIPRTLDYILQVAAFYPETSGLLHLMEELGIKQRLVA